MSERPNTRLVLEAADEAGPEAAPIRFEDAVLVRRVQDGDVAAFGTLVAKYQDPVYNACWRMCGNAEDARELTQEAFLRAYKGIAAFKGQSGFYTWLFRIAANLAISHRRKLAHRGAQSLDQPAGASAHDGQADPLLARVADGAAPSPAGRTLRAELAGQIEAALASLDPEHRTVVVLRDIEGMDYAGIAEVLEVAIGTVKSRLHRARVMLRERLAPYVDMK